MKASTDLTYPSLPGYQLWLLSLFVFCRNDNNLCTYKEEVKNVHNKLISVTPFVTRLLSLDCIIIFKVKVTLSEKVRKITQALLSKIMANTSFFILCLCLE